MKDRTAGDPMRILLLTQDFPPRPGGMAHYYGDWARGLGEDCLVATGTWRGSPPRRQGDEQLATLPFPADASHHPWNLWRAARRVGALTRDAAIDVLVAGNIRPFGPAALGVARATGRPLAVAYHGNDLLRTARRWSTHPLKARAWNRVAAGAALHVVNSSFTAGLAEAAGLPADRIAVAPPEVDTEQFHPCRAPEERAALRRALGWGDGEIVTLFVGRLIERKGLADLFAALGSLPPTVRLVIAGPGDVAPWRDRARAEAPPERVTFLGPVPDSRLPLLYRAADVFAGPSRDRREADDVEGFGIVFLEAAASGLPVLATRTGGIPEAVEDGGGGLLVPPADPIALVEAWTRLATDADLRRRLGDGGLAGRARTHGPGTSAAHLRTALSRIV